MDHLIVRLVVIAIVVALVTFWNWRARRRAARNIKRNIESAFQPQHVFRQASPQEFPWLSAAFYDEAQRDAERAGFVHLADVEDETLTQTHPDMRTFVRFLVLEDGRARAVAYEITRKGKSRRSREVIAELSDGSSIIVTTTPPERLLDRPAGLMRETVPESATCLQMLELSDRLVGQYREQHPDAAVEPVRTVEEATRAWQKGIDRQRKRLEAQGGISREEMMRLAPDGRRELAGRVHDEMRKL